MIRKYNNFIRTITARQLLMQVACWILLISYETLSTHFLYKQNRPFIDYAVYYSINIGFFYAVVSLWWQGTPNGSLWRRVLNYILLCGIYLSLKALADIVLNERKDISGWNAAITYLPATISRGVYFIVCAAFYITAGYLSRYRRKAAEAEIAYRQQQLQPHLLFNTLNMIYNSVGRHSEDAARSVWLLAELMQYSLHPGDEAGLVPVERETMQLYHLIEINRHRFDHQLFLETDIGDTEDACMIPLVLLTLTENLFKHGDLQDERHPAQLRLELKGKRLCFSTSNHLRDSGLPAGNGLGLENTRIRLEHAYGRDFVLTSGFAGEYFELYLEVPV